MTQYIDEAYTPDEIKRAFLELCCETSLTSGDAADRANDIIQQLRANRKATGQLTATAPVCECGGTIFNGYPTGVYCALCGKKRE